MPWDNRHRAGSLCFSALQRAENSSMIVVLMIASASCSFSALQRAENSSIRRASRAASVPARVSVLFSEPKIPQLARDRRDAIPRHCFSALQRAENSSMQEQGTARRNPARFSALQRAENSSMRGTKVLSVEHHIVSVLFSEPKIPQCQAEPYRRPVCRAFQCSSASRKFLNQHKRSVSSAPRRVSVLFSEPKIPQYKRRKVEVFRR